MKELIEDLKLLISAFLSIYGSLLGFAGYGKEGLICGAMSIFIIIVLLDYDYIIESSEEL